MIIPITILSLPPMLGKLWGAFRNGLYDLLFTAETRYTEANSGLLLIGFGLVLMFPSRGDPGVSDIQRGMQSFAPLWVWGLVVVIIGFLQGMGATFRQWVTLRVITAAIAGPCWLVFSLFIAISGYRVIGFIPYALLALMVSWAYIRMGAGFLSPSARKNRERHGDK